MCYTKLAEQANSIRRQSLVAEANRWANEAMPQPGKQRDDWVQRMLLLIDARLAELDEISGT